MGIAETIKALEKAINRDDLEQKRQGGQDITYVPWYVIAQALNDHAPGWSYQLSEPLFFDRTIKRNQNFETVRSVMVKATITIEGVGRQATGVEDLTGPNLGLFGDTFTNVSAAALRRCAALFGLGLFLYDKAETKEFLSENKPTATQPKPAPQATQANPSTQTKQALQPSQSSASPPQGTPPGDYTKVLGAMGKLYGDLGLGDDKETKKAWTLYIAGVDSFQPSVFTAEKIQAVTKTLDQIKTAYPIGLTPEKLGQYMRETAAEGGDVSLMIESLALVVGEQEVKKQKAQAKK